MKLPRDTRAWTGAAVLALLVLAAAWPLRQPLVGLHHDDGQFVVAARALATGEGYRQLHLVAAPPQTKIPPVFPAILAAVWGFRPDFPGNVPLLTAVGPASLALAAAVAYLFAVHALGVPRPTAWTATAAGFTTPALLGLSGYVMSEPLFLLLLIACLWALEAWRPDEKRSLALAASTLLGLCVLTRSVGVFVAAGVALWLAWQRRLGLAVIAPATALSAAWFGWSVAAGQAAGPVADTYSLGYGRWMAAVPLSAFGGILLDNLLAVPVHTGHLVLQPALWVVPSGARAWWSFAAGLVVVALTVRAARRVAGPTAAVMGIYVAGVVLWPWPPSRFLLVVLPVAWLLVAAAWRSAAVARAVACIAAVCLAANLVHAYDVAPRAPASGSVSVAGGPPAAVAEFQRLFAWVRARTPADAVLVSVAEPMLFLYGGRRGAFPYEQDTVRINYSVPPSIGTAHDLDRRLTTAGATYLVRIPAGPWAHADMLDSVIGDLRAARPARLVSVYQGSDPRFEVLRVDDTGAERTHSSGRK